MARLEALLAELQAGRGDLLAPTLASLAAGAADAGPEELSRCVLLAARCMELRARSLLPSPPPADPEPAEEGSGQAVPAEELAERLAGFAVYQSAAELLRSHEARWRERFPRPAPPPEAVVEPGVDLEALLAVFRDVWERARPQTRAIARETVSIQTRIAFLREQLRGAGRPLDFHAMFDERASRLDVVVTFLALLELVRRGEVRVRQSGPSEPLLLTWTGSRGPSAARRRQERPASAVGSGAAAGGPPAGGGRPVAGGDGAGAVGASGDAAPSRGGLG